MRFALLIPKLFVFTLDFGKLCLLKGLRGNLKINEVVCQEFFRTYILCKRFIRTLIVDDLVQIQMLVVLLT